MSQLEIDSRHRFFPRVTYVVTLLLTLCSLHGAAVQAQKSNSVQSTEKKVAGQVRAGKDVVLEKDREISADFLVTLLKSYKPPANDPFRGIRIENAEISGPSDFRMLTVPYWLVLEHCIFKEDADFTGSRFQNSFSVTRSTFMGKAIFYQISVEGGLRANKGKFKQDTNFDSVKVSGTVELYQSKFDGPFTLANSEMNKLECAGDDEEFAHAEFGSGADFYAISVKGDASFTQTSFAGSVDFGSVDIGKNFELTQVQFTNPNEVIRFFSMRVGGNAVFNETKFIGGFDLGQAEVMGRLEFGKTEATSTNRAKTFSGLKVASLVFNDATLAGLYDLEGADYRLLHAHTNGVDSSLDLIHGATYSRSNYSSLEDYYRRIGSDADANKVYLAGKDVERQKLYADGIISSYLWSLFLKVTVGYGKKPWWALIYSFVFIVIGFFFFLKEDWMMTQRNDDKAQYRGTYNPLWYSLALFLPVVDIGDAKIWAPCKCRRWARHYMRLHIVLGYLLVPIGLAAWTGLIK